MLQALNKVFRHPTYVVLAMFGGVGTFAFAVLLPNVPLIVSIMSHPDIAFADKISVPISLLGSIATNFTTLSAANTIAIAGLFGIDIALTVYLLKRRVRAVRQSGIAAGSLGAFSAVLGIGCAACGSLVVTSALAVFGVSGLITFLPLRGGEFGILAVLLLALSLYMITKQIQNPEVCST